MNELTIVRLAKRSGVNLETIRYYERRKIEIFSAGFPECEKAIKMVRSIACPSCKIEVLDMHNSDVAAKSRKVRRTQAASNRS
ncbi:MAG: hypothetical protein LC770_06275 [Acidobacteria bacterium]|nr:hypothetical protein [Acidobacteriota bacterium]